MPMGECCAAPVVCAGEEPGYCSSDFYQQSEKLATETQRHRGNKYGNISENSWAGATY